MRTSPGAEVAESRRPWCRFSGQSHQALRRLRGGSESSVSAAAATAADVSGHICPGLGSSVGGAATSAVGRTDRSAGGGDLAESCADVANAASGAISSAGRSQLSSESSGGTPKGTPSHSTATLRGLLGHSTSARPPRVLRGYTRVSSRHVKGPLWVLKGTSLRTAATSAERRSAWSGARPSSAS
jgi:hypothetical protein